MEQRVVHTIPGHALRTNPYYTDRVGIYTEVGKQRWIWRGVTHGERLHTEAVQIGENAQRGVTHRRGTRHGETQDTRRVIQRVTMQP